MMRVDAYLEDHANPVYAFLECPSLSLTNGINQSPVIYGDLEAVDMHVFDQVLSTISCCC